MNDQKILTMLASLQRAQAALAKAEADLSECDPVNEEDCWHGLYSVLEACQYAVEELEQEIHDHEATSRNS
jgi:hypothetical protein